MERKKKGNGRGILFVISMFACVSLIGHSCKQKQQRVIVDENDLREKILDANQNLLHVESNLIDSFILSHNFRMERTGSGLRYEIMKLGNDKKANEGDEVMMSYKAYHLDGTQCLSSSAKEPQQLRIGKGEQIKGVEETLMLLSEGGSARIVVPAHLAFGPRGDGDRVPPSSILYYELTLLAINK